jgi:hypothetical protein
VDAASSDDVEKRPEAVEAAVIFAWILFFAE